LGRKFELKEAVMKVLVAGAGGAVGRSLVPRLLDAGHDVVALARTERKVGELRKLGAEPVAADLLARESVLDTVGRARPEVIIHQATSLAGVKSLKDFDREFALTNRLRTEGVDHLVEAARAVGTRRLIAQSYGNWNYERSGARLKTEDDPFDSNPPKKQVKSLAAIRYLERAVLKHGGIEGVVLRYGNFYGPGTGFSQDGDIVRQLRRRQLPIVGNGGGVWSFVHVDDAASATVAAIDGPPGTYNVVDDHPRPVAEWLPELARITGARPPFRVPVWVGRLAAGEVGVSVMTQIRGTSNAKAGRELGWEPRYPRFPDGLTVA
jgi:nucleoside-diphosphate-sugar epimerase